MTHSRFRSILKVGFFFATGMLLGCGGGKVTVTGTVTFDGQPVDGGAISLATKGEKTSGPSAVITDGKYTITAAADKLPPGVYSVVINWMKPTGKKVKVESMAGIETDETKQVIPAEYNTATKLTFEVKSGSNTANFELKAGGAVSVPSSPGTGGGAGNPFGAPPPQKKGGGK